MESFHLLSRGGPKFDKQKYHDHVKLFNSSSTKSRSHVPSPEVHSLPPELDFFKYASTSKEPKSKGKRKQAANTDEVVDSEEEKPPYLPAQAPSHDSHRIAATGSRVPAAVNAFDELHERYQVSTLLLQNIKKSGFQRPTAVQAQCIPILLESRDLAAISPTGTGKTLAYLAPIFSLLRSPLSSKDTEDGGSGARALIIAPTRELAGQVYNECLKLAQGRKWRITLFSKSTGSTLADKQVRDKVDIIISTPLRLIAALRDGSIELDNVRHLVLDESDRLLDSAFLDQTEEVVSACTHPDLRKAVFSATLPSGAEAVAKRMLNDPIRVVVGLKDSASLYITQTLTYVGSETGKLMTLRQLLASAPPLPMLIFVQSKERASELHQELLYDNLTSDVLHSGMTAKQRGDTLARLRSGDTWVLVCTDVMARGMDFGGIKGVVNYDFPQSVQSYIHRIGRTGRAERSGTAITYWTDADAPFIKAIANVIHQSNVQQMAFASASATNLSSLLDSDPIVPPSATIPDWMLKLPKPSQLKRRQLKRHGPERKGVGVVAGRHVGKKLAIRRREMVRASKKRAEGTEHDSPSINQRGAGVAALDENWSGITT